MSTNESPKVEMDQVRVHNVIKFFAFQQGAFMYFKFLQEYAERERPAPENLNRAARREWDSNERDRKKAIKNLSKNYQNMCNRVIKDSVSGLNKNQVGALTEVSYYFMDIIDQLPLFGIAMKDRDAFLGDLQVLVKSYIEKHQEQFNEAENSPEDESKESI